MKIKMIATLAAIAVVLGSLTVGGTIAAFRAETEATNRITVGKLGIDLIEKSEDQDVVLGKDGLHYTTTGMPGDVRSRQIQVKNTEDYDAYVRIAIERYWVDGAGEKVFEANPALIELMTDQPKNWIEQADPASAGETIYYYYKSPVKSGETTDRVLNEFKISEAITQTVEKNGTVVVDFTKLGIQMNVRADAVQATAGAEAMKATWGVNATLDGDALTAVSTQS